MPHFLIKRRNFLISAIAIVILSSCSIFESESNEVLDSLQIQLNLDKNEIAPGESFLATYSVSNTSNQKLYMITSCSEFAGAIVLQNDQSLDLHGISNICMDILGGFNIEPQQSLNFEWEIHAFTLAKNNTNQSYDTTNVASGDYVLSIYTNVVRINGEDAIVDLVKTGFSIK